jgi:DNA adenine methylase
MKPFIRWSGKKTKCLKHIIPLLPNNTKTYFEPFLGSGALFLHMQPSKWVINDLNGDLISVWNSVHYH